MNKYIYFLLLSLMAICPIAAMEPIDGLHNGMAHATPKTSPAKKRKQSQSAEQLETKASRTTQQEYAIPAAAKPQSQESYDDFFDELPPLESPTPTHNTQFMEEFEQEMESTCAQGAASTLTKKYICKCGKSFNTGAWREHILAIHLNIKPHQCPAPGCRHSATQSTNLKQHIKAIHPDIGDLKPIPLSNERKYEINKLIDEFQKQNSMQNVSSEAAAPTLAKKYICKCKESFRYLVSLKSHIKADHLNIKPFQCPAPGCMQNCAKNGSLMAHIKAMHADLGDLKLIPLSQEREGEIDKLIAEYIV